ncbi:hypothetical protein ABAC460_19855 [Asticcacaulis sp. AC460]|uniref:beta strand repeat-containing protein n=1 Tax=Asticcacaulis sp. AC460 TaxID=1282360 RepID=UPI0003C3C56B|nr:autotransporter-associated beta strand repeat-containing protein [Asticcacaulis sp. AC460]ESQ87280.1 hypothetical protein ABAC460_19855 [Asticcacaulis sp. AC460]
MSDNAKTHLDKALLANNGDGDFGIAADGAGRGQVYLQALATPDLMPVQASGPVVAGDGDTGGKFAAYGFESVSAGSGLMQAAPTGEFQVNTYTTGTQARPSVAADSDGDFVVVWHSNLQDGNGNGIFGQRFNASGVAQGSEFRANTYTTSAQQNPDAAMDSDGDFVVVWDAAGNQDGNGVGTYFQRYNASGVAQGGETKVNTYTTGAQGAPSVAMDTDGDFVVVWQSNGQDLSGYGVFGQRYNASGAAQGAEFQINTYTTGAQSNVQIAMADNGDFVVTWTSNLQDGDSSGVFGQRYNASGATQGSEFQVNTYTTGVQNNAKVAMDADGDFVVVWQSNGQDGDNNGVYGQRFNASGVAQGSEFKVNTYTTSGQGSPSVAMDADGDFVVTWASNFQDGDVYGVYGQYYTAAGVAVGSEFLVNTYTTNTQIRTDVRMDDDGDFIVAWDSAGQDGNGTGIYARIISAPSTAPVLANLAGDSFALASAGQFTALDGGTAATITSAALTTATLAVNRVKAGVADGNAHDTYSLLSSSLFSVDISGGAFGGVSAGALAGATGDVTGTLVSTASGLAFARYTYVYATGTLTIAFGAASGDSGVTGTPTEALIADVLAHIGYGSARPYGDGTLRVTLHDSGGDATADVTFTSANIYVDRSDDDAGGDASDGFSLREALARGVAQSGADTIHLGQLTADTTVTLAGSTATLGAGDTLKADTNNLTIAGSTGGGLVLGGAATVETANGAVLTVTAALSGGNVLLTKTGSGTLVLTGNNSGLTGGMTISEGTLSVAGDVNLSTGSLSMGAGTTLEATGSTTIDNDMAMGVGGEFTVEVGADVELTLTGETTGTWFSYIKTGAGTLVLNGNGEAASSSMIVEAGTVEIDTTVNLGSGAVTMKDGTTLVVTGDTTIEKEFYLEGATTISVDQDVTITMILTSSSGLTKAGAGTLTVSAPDLTGDLIVSTGTLVMGGIGSNSNVYLAEGTTLSFAGGGGIDGTVTLGGAATIAVAQDATLSVNGSLIGSANLTKDGAGTLVLASGDNEANLTGALIVAAGTVSVEQDNNLVGGTVTLKAGTTLAVTGTDAEIDNAIVLDGAATLEIGNTATLSTALTGSGGLTKTGSGTLVLSNTGNETNFTGGVIVSEGTLSVTDDDALVGGTVTLAEDTTLDISSSSIDNAIAVTGAAKIAFSGSAELSGNLTGSGDLSFEGPSSATRLTLSGSNAAMTGGLTVTRGRLNVASDDNLSAGTVTLGQGATLVVTADAEIDNAVVLDGSAKVEVAENLSVTLSGIISGAYTLDKEGDGALILSGNNSGLTGGLTVLAGSVMVSDDTNLGTGTVNLEGGATLWVTADTTIDNAIALNGAATIAISPDLTVTVSGSLSGASDLTKAGEGTLVLTDTDNEINFTGGVVVSEGTLSVSNDDALAAGPLTLNEGATLAVTGATDIDNDIVVTGDAFLALGANVTVSGGLSGAGGLQVTGSGSETLTLTDTGNEANMSGSITVSAGTLAVADDNALSRGQLILATGAILSLTGSTTIDNTITLNGNANVSTATGVAATLSGDLGGSSTLTKAGAGTLTLTGSNSSMGGGLSITAGTVSVAGDGNLTGGTVSLAGGSLAVTGSTTIDNAIAMTGVATVDVATSTTTFVTLSGALTGAFDLTKTGVGKLTLTGDNSGLSGGLTVSGGTLSVASDGNLGTGAVTLGANTTFNVDGTTTIDNSVVLTGNAILSTTNATSVTLSGALSGDGFKLTKTGGVKLVLTNTGNEAGFTGGLQINGGTVDVAADDALVGGTVTLNGGTLGVTAATTIDNAVVVSGASTVRTDAAVTLSGALTGSSTLTKSGAGTLTLSGSNSSMSGGLTVSAGTVSVAGDSNLVGGSVSLAAGTTLSVSGATTIDNAVALTGAATISAGAAVSLSGNLTGSSILTKAGAGTLTLSGSNSAMSGGLTVSAGGVSVAGDSNLTGGTVTLAGSTTLSVTGATTIDNAIALTGNATIAADAAVTLSGSLSGTSGIGGAPVLANLTKTGSGTLTLTNTGNEAGLTGGVTVSAGTLAVSDDDALVGGTVTLAASTTLSVTGATTIDNAIALTGAASIATSAAVTLSGALTGSSTLSKTGSGTLTLSGSGSGLSGGLAVSAGTLQVNSTFANVTTVTVGGTLYGSGTIGTAATSGAVSVVSGGTIGAGTGTGVGLLTLNNGLTIASGATLGVNIAGTTVGTQYDQISVTGAVDLTGANLYFNVGFTATIGDSFVLIANDGTDAITGTLASLAEGTLLSEGGRTFQLSYIGGTGNDLTATVVNPAPAFTSGATADFAENDSGTVYQAAASTVTGSPIVWTLSGTDAALFEIDDETGVVTFLASPDYEAPEDSDGNNVYNIAIRASAGGYSTDQAVAITITDIGEALIGTEAADNLTATGTIRRVEGLGNDDTLTGSAGNDVLVGGAGMDRLNGMAGVDTLEGGADSDIYYLDNGEDTVTEEADGGDGDYVVLIGAATSYTLAANVENLYVSATVAGTFSGNELANVIVARNDAAATLMGGAGNDTYRLGDDQDVVSEDLNEGIDSVEVEFTYTLTAHVENLVLGGSDDIYGTGNALANVITGNDGDNRLDGGVGADTLYGGAGDDIYIVDNENDLASEQKISGTDDGGFDQVRASVSYTLGAYIEALRLTGSVGISATGNASANYLYGNGGSNVLDGKGGADIMDGGAGNDTYYVDVVNDNVIEQTGGGTDEVIASVTFALATDVENLTLSGSAHINATGNSQANHLTGNSGNNRLDGGAGADTMAGGTGNDTYVIDNDDDSVTEADGGGTDTIEIGRTYTLAAYFENLVLTGTGHIDGTGNSDNNSLRGNDHNNSLDGGIGADSLAGGAGDDAYFVDNAADTITETLNAGIDRVYSGITFTLSAHVENLYLTGSDDIYGTGNDGINVLTGNTGDNRLDGKGGADIMYGGAGDDVYIIDDSNDLASEDSTVGHNDGGFDTVRSSVSYTLGAFIENLRLTGSGNINATGNSLANYLYGTAGDNVLDGSYGGDIMAGGGGNDTYYVNVATDNVIEELGAGTDKVISQISYSLADGLENLELASWGTAATNAWGNAVANTVTGGRGSNQLYGLGGNDNITGGEGNDTLDGGTGVDTLSGGVGSDVYYIDPSDTIVEDAGAGTDTVFTSHTYTLLTNFERLTLEGSSNINATGNTVGNIITGNSGNNVLDGAAGADTMNAGAGNDIVIGGTGNDLLTGGDGADTFVFARNGGGTDHVADFQVGVDHLAFNASEFTNTLANTIFTSNSTGTAVGNTGQFIYNTTTHTLVWDSNGTGAGGITATVVFDTNVTVTKADLIFQ